MDGSIGTIKTMATNASEKISVRFNVTGCTPTYAQRASLSKFGKPSFWYYFVYMIYLNLTKKFSRPDFEVILEDEEIKIWLNCIYGPGEEMPEEYRAVFENEFYIVSVTVSMHSIYILTI